ncbi:MAG: hypothetical protein KKC01_01005 [Gammaproteobacteria bacterium]|nr:hypothetical protein [Gammaproteobacteria bacterium]
MTIPTWEDLVRPVLEYACEQPITRRSAAARMFEVIPLTDEERGVSGHPEYLDIPIKGFIIP